MVLQDDFGKFLERLRGNMSLREAAKKSGLSHAYIRDLELGKNRSTNERITPSPETLKKLSSAYGYSYTDLMQKAGHLVESDISSGSRNVIELDLQNVMFIEIGRKEITYFTNDLKVIQSIASLHDFNSFLEKLDIFDFKKVDADVYVNFNQIKYYDEKAGRLYFDENGTGPFVTMSAIRQKKYQDQILRSLARNRSTSLEYTFGRGAFTGSFGVAERGTGYE
ncbi:helix-turn-helix domain-containing protein [Paenibacillus hamazuiensis]|uniref:helix-turn-helix domain-containing protein n=1 Tax=Paenibacillus hamazuiensis TaxID=2936508 RepID=UPI00200D76FC|nr:helix-turn-helix transcriptional regulator [Paenibacillus hamazuiensis]